MDEIFADRRVIDIGYAAAEYCDDLIINLILPEVAECLDKGAADPSRSGHVSRGGVLKDDFPFADPDLSGGAVGQENDAGRNLLRDSQDIGSIGSGGLDTNSVAGDKGSCDGVCRRGHRAEDGVVYGVIVEAASELADGAGSLESAETGINCRRAAQRLEMLRSEHPTPAVAINPATNL